MMILFVLCARALIGTRLKLRRDERRKDHNIFFPEKWVYEKLGLQEEDEKETRATQEGCDTSARDSLPSDFSDDLICGDELPNEDALFCDWKNSVMMLESRYKDMTTFRLAMRQFAIKNEFELGIEASCPSRYKRLL
jgi:hypothetical protein